MTDATKKPEEYIPLLGEPGTREAAVHELREMQLAGSVKMGERVLEIAIDPLADQERHGEQWEAECTALVHHAVTREDERLSPDGQKQLGLALSSVRPDNIEPITQAFEHMAERGDVLAGKTCWSLAICAGNINRPNFGRAEGILTTFAEKHPELPEAWKRPIEAIPTFKQPNFETLPPVPPGKGTEPPATDTH